MCNTYNSNARDHTIYLLVPLQRNSKCILKFVALNLHARLNSQEQSPCCRGFITKYYVGSSLEKLPLDVEMYA